MPKQFLSAKGVHCIRCSIKANDGLLYPLAKCFIFIHKPTIIVKFDDIELIEFKRYEPVANSATRNFDLMITLRDSAVGPGESKEYMFMSIDRSEYASLFDYIQSKELKVKNPQPAAPGKFDLGPDEDDDDEEDDEDYNSAKASEDDSGSGSDDGSEEEEEEEERKPVKREKAEKKPKKEKPEKKEKKEKVEKPKKEKKEKAEKPEKATKVLL